MLIVVAALCWFVSVVIRMLFFLPPVVVAERRIGLIRAWELGRGNFWRMVAVLLAVLGPVWIGLHAVLFAVVGPLLPMDLIAHFHAGMARSDVHQLVLEIVRRVLLGFRGMVPFLIAYALIEQLLYAGLANGAVADAYLSVTAEGGTS